MEAHETAHWFDPLFTTSGMRRIFSDAGRLTAILDFEAALARSQARVGVIPGSVVRAIEANCRAERFDIGALSRASALAGNSAIPIVNTLEALVAKTDADAAQYVHWGATSQDAMDTGLVLQLRAALDLMESDLASLSVPLAELARAHKATLIVGRTWLQHASPTTFGLKTAGWLSAINRSLERIRAMRPRVLALQFGGSTGTLSALGEHGLRVAAALADDLRLALPDLPWHTHRDRAVEVATTLGLMVGTLGKFARDISLMAQSEVGELAEPHETGRGESSSMPHKSNPVGCAVVLAAAVRVPALVSVMLSGMVQEHERGLGGWHAEWETLPEICTLAAGALAQIHHIVKGLRIDTDRMAANLEAARGLVQAEAVTMSLARSLGRSKAHEPVQRACRLAIEQGCHLREALAADPQILERLSAADLNGLFDLEHEIRYAASLVERVLKE